MKLKKISFCLAFLLFMVLKDHAQVRITGVSQTSAFSNALNGTTRAAKANQTLTAVSNGAVIKPIGGIDVGISSRYSDWINRNQTILINYGVPDRVMLDRLLLSSELSRRIADFLNLQQITQNSGLSAASKQQLVNLYQQDINRLQSIWDGLSTTCAPVSFKDYRATVNADVRYNPAVGGSIGLLRQDGGDVNFSNVAFSAIEGNPVRATIRIYKK